MTRLNDWWTIAGVALCCAAVAVDPAHAQEARRLTLKEAESLALGHHPNIKAGEDLAQATREASRAVRSAYYPTIAGSLTGAAAEDGTRIAAGGLNNPTILDRVAMGVAGTQLLTDFGRTAALAASADFRAEAQQQDVASRRARVLLEVDRAYFAALAAQGVQRVAADTVAARQLIVDQVGTLAASGLKSSLDLSFAKVSLGEAQLLLVQAKNDVQAAYANLTVALGGSLDSPPGGPVGGGPGAASGEGVTSYVLSDEPVPPPPAGDATQLVADALRDRPDLAGARLTAQAADTFAGAERALRLPTVAAAGAAGVAPYHGTGLNDHYSAIGVTVTVPVFNGRLFAARRAEAAFRARADAEQVVDLEHHVSRDVQVARLAAASAFERLDLTRQLLAHASDALDLAQARYNLGLSSIVELTQAQLSKTRAEIEQTTARYDYQARAAALRYQVASPP